MPNFDLKELLLCAGVTTLALTVLVGFFIAPFVFQALSK